MPKNIVLLSDGTGNAASSPFKTNVWRLYQALDIATPDQIASYSNGVGTEAFKPLAIIGLALGIGVAQNVQDLYAFLCRNYRPGDNIYLFGFSRGAFTIRVLAGLILRCGIVTAQNDAELDRRVSAAYAEYKRDVARRANATRNLFLGWIFGGFKRGSSTDHIRFDEINPQYMPRIRFIGVWDTVDAYGMPIDELKEGIDRHIWPMTLADRKLSDHIDRVCHALSLDDERPTFRPVLWTDPNQDRRLSQVWFAGVHANVGGGYPDGGLSGVALRWIMDEAEVAGLRFNKSLKDSYSATANSQGQQYDSRAGLAGYYRYGPRNVSALCDDHDHGVNVACPQVHHSALDRIADRQVAYAPVSLGETPYSTVKWSAEERRLVTADAVETAAQIAERERHMQPAYNAVFRRRVTYFATLFLTIGLLFLPVWDLILETRFGREIAAPFEPATTGIYALLSHIPYFDDVQQTIAAGFDWARKTIIPTWAGYWADSFSHHLLFFVVSALLLAWLFVRKSQLLEGDILARAEQAWAHVRKVSREPKKTTSKSAITDPVVQFLQIKPIRAIYNFLSWRVVPFLFAFFVALPVALVLSVFFLPKFYRDAYYHRHYRAHVSDKQIGRGPDVVATS